MSAREQFIREIALDMLRDQIEEYVGVGDIAEYAEDRVVEDGDDSGIYRGIYGEIQEIQRWLVDQLDNYYTS